MKRQALLLILVAVMSLAGATEAFCQKPQRSKVHVKPMMDYRVRETAEANFIEDFLEKYGPYTGGNPGPFLPGPEQEELVTDIMVDILLEQQFSPENYDYDVPVFLRKNSKGQLEGIIFLEGWILIIDKDRPLVIEVLPGVDDPAEYEGSDGDDVWDVLQGY